MTLKLFQLNAIAVITGALLGSLCPAVSAPPPPTESGKPTQSLARGVTYCVDRIDTPPLTLHTLIIDTSAPGVRLKAEKGKHSLFRGESVPVLAKRLANSSRNAAGVMAAVNGDFYEADFSPTGMLATDGWIWKGPWTGSGSEMGSTRSVLAIDDLGHIRIGPPRFDVSLAYASGDSIQIDCINLCSGTSTTIAYTPQWGQRTPRTTVGRVQVALRLAKAQFLPNAPVQARITAVSRHGALALDRNIVVLDMAAPVPANIRIGARVVLRARMAGLPGRVVEVVGGLPRLIDNGVADPVQFAREEILPERVVSGHYARTAVGVRADGHTVVIVVADGTEPHSVGMSLPELAEYLKSQGCVNALNLDGGGSSTMVVRGNLVNKPSDQPQGRPVGTSLLIIAPEP